MRGNSGKQIRSFTTGQTTSPRKRGARDNRPLDNTQNITVLPKATGRDKTLEFATTQNKSQTWECHTTPLNVACH